MQNILLTLAAALTFLGAYQGAAPAADAPGLVRGTVSDANQALMFGAKVVIFNEGRRVEVTTDTEGEFQATVPKGTYHIQALAPNFCTAERAPFEVAAGSSVTLNLIVVVTPIVNSIYKEPGAPVTETDRPECPFRVDRISVPHARKAGSEVWVQSGDIKKVGAMNCYTGYFSERKTQRVIVSYDLLTLYADEVCVNGENELTAFGNTEVERGDGKLEGLRPGDVLNYKELVIKAASK